MANARHRTNDASSALERCHVVRRHATHRVAGVRPGRGAGTGERAERGPISGAVRGLRRERRPDAAPRPSAPVAGPAARARCAPGPRVRPPRRTGRRGGGCDGPGLGRHGDLAAGTELAAGDLQSVDVRLGDAAASYLSTGTRPEGRTLSRSVRAGELLPRSALDEPAELVQLALPVQSGYVPPGLDRGQLVDVYAVADPAAGATGVADGSVTLVVRRAGSRRSRAGPRACSRRQTTAIQVVIAVSADEAPDVLAAIAGRPLVVVVHDSVDADPVTAQAGPTG